MISVIATVSLKEGKKDAYLAELWKIIPAVRRENGCIEYAPYVHIDSGSPLPSGLSEDTVIVIEKWESLDALRMHGQTAHMDSYRQSIKGIIVSVQVQVLNPV
jgi:quinol monooxygenase YgiN